MNNTAATDLVPSVPQADPLSNPVPEGVPQAHPYPALWINGLRGTSRNRKQWLWEGYLAPGTGTLLTSQWKSGKTTLVTVLLDRLGSGGELAGLPLTAGKALVISEESAIHWERRCDRFAFGDHVCWLCRPFKGKPSPEE